MYLYDTHAFFSDKRYRTKMRWFGVTANILILLIGAFLLVAGTYGSVISIRDGYENGGTAPWSCADNSGSV
ncbi:hypothetical protein JCM6882_006475 [Rhodosporidiobolus microsporus]